MPKNLSQFSRDEASKIQFVFTDIDDTLTTNGKLLPQAYLALSQIQQQGLKVIPVTGRPAGWCDQIIRLWPVDAVIGENGAFYMWLDSASNKIQTHHILGDKERMSYQERLSLAQVKIQANFPEIRFASDQFSRMYDLAIDVCEDVNSLSDEKVQSLIDFLEREGMSVKLSSIHINAWFGAWDKLSATKSLMMKLFGTDLDLANTHCAFIGDSPNDAPMFSYFKNSFGVANVLNYESKMTTMPNWITSSPGSIGFAEFAAYLLDTQD
jgi:HAD superfamily hydrolase (TIGR01484 family)